MARPQNCPPLCLPEMRLVDRWRKCQKGGMSLPLDQMGSDAHGDGTDEGWRDRLRDSRENEMQRVNAGHDLIPNAIVAYWAGTCRSYIEGPLEEAPQGTEPFAMS
ncbi:hypothetical protein NEUTE1DRAFT_98134 [Neurospora tetrasperma FGSC 2508]|uniref:Uncharacterized protein n=1 Tax=Neurospora tetrasperma (strain FGSC 2508 / ATCC MYA-4615 / P0657) TaxID=510951 RepID=F8MAQ5_NEUT8|nr:uncharacterized protein NEUTE1DRAFT_98134 [Neurospora tetrasperma FGSC 2508]EGO60978.1 hypothetical protein NEUTE1DRAFT_98134 [Neurospora tetrasperma FGSC 2508]